MARYAIFSAFYLPHLGGIEQFTDSLARELVADGNVVDIVTSRLSDSPEREVLCEGLTVWRLPCWLTLNGRFPIPKKNHAYRRMIRDLSRKTFDGFLVNARYYGLSLEGLKLARTLTVPVVVLDHSSFFIGFGIPAIDGLVHAYERFVTERIKTYHPAFCGVSEKSVEWLRTFGITARGVIHNAIDAESFLKRASARNYRGELGLASDTFIIVYTGRLVGSKGVDIFLEVARRFESTGHSGLRFLIAGDGELREKYEAEAPGNAVFLGRLSREDVSSLLQQSNAFCFPSKYPEGLPTSLLEAAACGLPIVISDVGGAREVIPEQQFGIVIDAATPEKVYEGLLRYVEDSGYAQSVGEAVQHRVATEFSWEKTAASFKAALIP